MYQLESGVRRQAARGPWAGLWSAMKGMVGGGLLGVSRASFAIVDCEGEGSEFRPTPSTTVPCILVAVLAESLIVLANCSTTHARAKLYYIRQLRLRIPYPCHGSPQPPHRRPSSAANVPLLQRICAAEPHSLSEMRATIILFARTSISDGRADGRRTGIGSRRTTAGRNPIS